MAGTPSALYQLVQAMDAEVFGRSFPKGPKYFNLISENACGLGTDTAGGRMESTGVSASLRRTVSFQFHGTPVSPVVCVLCELFSGSLTVTSG